MAAIAANHQTFISIVFTAGYEGGEGGRGGQRSVS